MATVTGFTAARMQQIEDAAIVDGDIVGDNLILSRFDGGQIDAGNVRGPQGIQGVPGATSIAVVTSGTRPTGGSVFEGLAIYETDTERFYIYDGGAWRYRGGLWLCTNATRPASPFEGLEIFETDTDTKYIYDGSTWRQMYKIGVWTDYTPTDTAITVGNGTRTAAYRLLDPNTCQVRWTLALGSTSTIGVGAAAGMPFASRAFQSGHFQIMSAYYLDAGVRNHVGTARVQSGLQKAELIHAESGGSGAVDGSGTAPFAWSTGDFIGVGGIYEI